MNIDLSKPDLNKPDNNKADSNNSNSNKPDSKPQLTEKYKVDMFIGLNAENFHPHDLMIIKDKLEKMNDDKFFLIQGVGTSEAFYHIVNCNYTLDGSVFG